MDEITIIHLSDILPLICNATLETCPVSPCMVVSDLSTRIHWPVGFSFCNYRHLALWSDVFSYVLLLTRNYHGLFFSSLFFHMEVRVIVSTFVESTTERRFLLKLHWIYRFIRFSWRLINLFITLGIAIHEYRMSPYLCL